jgi:Uma2 family endonuclease
MSTALIAPELEPIPNRRPLPVEAYYRLVDLGFLDGRFEILDGEVIDKMGQTPPHAVTLSILMDALSVLFGRGRVRVQAPIAIPGSDGVYNEPEPDIVVTRDQTSSYLQAHPGPEGILLVVEVSDTTLRTDIILKARLYARAGIVEYWVLDLASRQLHVHHKPQNNEYSAITTLVENETVATLALPHSSVSVSNLLPPGA